MRPAREPEASSPSCDARTRADRGARAPAGGREPPRGPLARRRRRGGAGRPLRGDLGRRDGRRRPLPLQTSSRPRRSGTERWPRRPRTWRRWAPGRARPTSRSGCRPGSTPIDALALVEGAHELAGELGITIAGGDITRAPGADRVVHGGRAGRTIRMSWSAATARGRATGSRSPARWGRRERGSRCSTGAPAPASTDAARRAARALRPTAAAPDDRTRAGRARRHRDDRPVGRAGHRRRPSRPAQRRADRALAVLAAGRRRRERGRGASSASTRGRSPPPPARTTSCASACPPHAEARSARGPRACDLGRVGWSSRDRRAWCSPTREASWPGTSTRSERGEAHSRRSIASATASGRPGTRPSRSVASTRPGPWDLLYSSGSTAPAGCCIGSGP